LCHFDSVAGPNRQFLVFDGSGASLPLAGTRRWQQNAFGVEGTLKGKSFAPFSHNTKYETFSNFTSLPNLYTARRMWIGWQVGIRKRLAKEIADTDRSSRWTGPGQCDGFTGLSCRR